MLTCPISLRLEPLVYIKGDRAGRRQSAHRVPVRQRPSTLLPVSVPERALDCYVCGETW